jgi:hypothetical protein
MLKLKKFAIIHKNNMEYVMANNTVKITFSAPMKFKTDLDNLKQALHVPISTILVKAVNDYKAKLEADKWEKAVTIMNNEYCSDLEMSDWANFEEDIHENY